MQSVVILGASCALGRALSERLTRTGTHVIPVDDVSVAGEGIHAIDVTDESAWTALVETIPETGPVHLVVCAGAVDAGGLLDATPDVWDRTVRRNQLGPVVATKRMLPALTHTRGSRALYIRSALGNSALAGAPLLHAAGGALSQLARNVAVNHADKGLRANAVLVSPYCVAFEELSLAMPDLLPENPPPQSAPVGLDDVIEVIGFLLSPASDGINGAEIPVDGGYLAQ